MVRATWKGQVLAKSDETVLLEGNHYFPIDDVDTSLLQASEHTTFCGWKGEASYYHVVVDGEKNENAAWSYPDPKEAAKGIAGRIAFWKGVKVQA